MQLEIAVLSKSGGRSRNEDACGYRVLENNCCLVVSDGAGGHSGGDIASKAVVSSILNEFAGSPALSAESVRQLIDHANSAVLRNQQEQQALSDMRATAAVLEIDLVAKVAIWGHLGDTRVYCYRDGRLLFQTRDHSVVQSMLESGVGDSTLLRHHPKRNVLLSALGSEEEISPTVQDTAAAVQAGDVFLLCTDGLWEYVEEETMERLLSSSASAQTWLEALEAEVLAHAKPDHDNYSAIAAWVSDSINGEGAAAISGKIGL